MALVVAIVMVVAALAALALTPAGTLILGLSHPGFAALAFAAALLITLGPSTLRGAQLAGVLRSLGAAAVWGVFIVALADLYENRQQLAEISVRLIEVLAPDEPTLGQGGEVIIKSRFNGGFFVPAKVNDRPVRFVFDTGATTVVLTAEDARRVGLDLASLDFSAPVATANGSALAAPVKLARLSVGPIVARNVKALVTKPGAMRDSLLGMSFLERLDSFAVERGQLVLKAK